MREHDKTPPEIVDEFMRRERRDFVREVNSAVEGRNGLTNKEQGDILRRMAEQLDKADDQRALLQPTRDRLEAKYEPTAFFTGQDRHRRYWEGRARSPDYKAAARSIRARDQQQEQDEDQEPEQSQ